MSDKPFAGTHDPTEILSAIKNKTLGTLWQKDPPNEDDMVAAFQLAIDVGATAGDLPLCF